MNVLTRIRMGEGLSDGERALAQALLADPERALGESVKQLARRAHVSQATVYRLCEKLGCSGLSGPSGPDSVGAPGLPWGERGRRR